MPKLYAKVISNSYLYSSARYFKVGFWFVLISRRLYIAYSMFFVFFNSIIRYSCRLTCNSNFYYIQVFFFYRSHLWSNDDQFLIAKFSWQWQSEEKKVTWQFSIIRFWVLELDFEFLFQRTQRDYLKIDIFEVSFWKVKWSCDSNAATRAALQNQTATI